MPIYPYKCIHCEAEQELWLDRAADEVQGGSCKRLMENGNPAACIMYRQWAGHAPGIGRVEGSGFSKARPPL